MSQQLFEAGSYCSDGGAVAAHSLESGVLDCQPSTSVGALKRVEAGPFVQQTYLFDNAQFSSLATTPSSGLVSQAQRSYYEELFEPLASAH
jgi:hypothetical protein